MRHYLRLTSSRGTTLYVNAEAIIYIEGFTFSEDDEHIPNHNGARISVLAGQWSDSILCRETPDGVLQAPMIMRNIA